MASKSDLGLVHIFWGNGKGKTTSALGTALRACGSGLTVHLVQFMKNGASTLDEQIPGEIKALTNFDNFTFKRFGLGDWYVKGKNDSLHKEKVHEALHYLKSCFGKYDVIIADEILYAVQLGFLSEGEVIQLVKAKPANQELILIGSHKPLDGIFAVADLITEMKKIKHPFDKGVIARKGIDF